MSQKISRRSFVLGVLAALPGAFWLGQIFSKRFERLSLDIPEKTLKEADFYKQHDLAG